MKRKLLIFGLLSAVIFSGLAFSCSNYLHESTGHENDRYSEFTISEIKRIFASDYAVQANTRTGDCSEEDFILAPGFISPLWDSLLVHYDYAVSYVAAEVPFDCRYEYRVFYPESEDSGLHLMPNQLVVYRNLDTNETASWLFFLFPDPATDSKDGYSGLALYATLSGFPLCVGKYQSGNLIGSASWMNDPSWGGDASVMAELLEGVYVARVESRPSTRGVNDDNQIEPVVIVGEVNNDIPEPDFPDDELPPLPVPEDMNFRIKVGGGGGTPSTDIQGDSYDRNPKIKVDDRSRQILDSLVQTCIGELMVNSVKEVVHISYDLDAPNSNVVFDPEKPDFITITVGPKNSDVGLLEELIHVYQGFSYQSYHDKALNYEVEVKLIWSMFYVGYDNMPIVSNCYANELDGYTVYQDMFNCLGVDDFKYKQAFHKAAKYLREVGYDPNSYPYDPDVAISDSIEKILKHCNKLMS